MRIHMYHVIDKLQISNQELTIYLLSICDRGVRLIERDQTHPSPRMNDFTENSIYIYIYIYILSRSESCIS